MYKIYNNEIKITNFLKGGRYPKTLESSFASKEIVNPTDNKFKLEDNDPMVKEDLKHFHNMFNVTIDMESKDKTKIGDTATEIGYVIERIHDALFNGKNKVFNSKTVDDANLGSIKILNKNVLRYAVSFAKTIGLFDDDNNQLLKLSDYEKKFGANGSSGITEAKNRHDMLFTKKKTDLEQIIEGVNFLIKKYDETVDCKAIYAQINPKNIKFTHWSQGGGAHDNLSYILNGGMVTSLIRIPDMVNYFKSQLKLVELRLKNVNKVLSEQSKQQIKAVIDKLELHEKNLKDTFELLKNAHTIDSDKIDLKIHETELENAKKSLKKHATYSNIVSAIIDTAFNASSSIKVLYSA